MITYSEFRPTGFDAAGLGCYDQQDWLVGPVARNRDSDCLTRSNWRVVTADIAKAGPEDCEIHRFGHWTNGWFELILVRPDSVAAKCAEEWESALADYPVASDDDFSDLEHQETCQYWAEMSLNCRRAECLAAGVSKLEAYRPIGRLSDRLFERLCES